MQRTRQYVSNFARPMLVGAMVCTLFANIASGTQIVDHQSEVQQLFESQLQLAERYQLLENKLFSLHEYEKETNPLRSKLLKMAYLQSQEKMTASELRKITKLLGELKLKDAETTQKQILLELKSLLVLLESEDRGKRVRDDILQYQEYLKEIDRLIRIQQGIRGQAEGNEDNQRLANSQAKIGERAAKLANEIRRNDQREQQDAKNPDHEPEPDKEESKSEQPNSSDGEDSSSDSEPPSSPTKENPQNSDGNIDNRQSGQDASGPPETGRQGNDSGSGPQSEEQQTPLQQNIDAAQNKMREAQRKLEQAKRSESVEEMNAAERELEKAKKELEAILRQLREEEVERTLAMLEGRFRQMLEREIRIRESTLKLDQVQPTQRTTDFEVRSGRLGTEQNSLATEASRALMLLRDDGSSVALPETVAQMRDDMIQVAQRLTGARVGEITLEVQQDIIDTLEYLIEALVTTQQDLDNMQNNQQQQSAQGQPGQQALVDQLAEIKMLRGLQDRIYKRHQRYSQLLTNPNDLVGQADDVQLQRALQRLADKQGQLAEITRDIVSGKNK